MEFTNFTSEEIYFIAVYAAETKKKTLENIFNALPDIHDREIKKIAENAVAKLDLMNEKDFLNYDFTAER